MHPLDAHAATYGEQPERRDAYLDHLARERALAALVAELAPPAEKPAKQKAAPEA